MNQSPAFNRPATGLRHMDAAAPLIGESGVMCALRERIAQVAATDFCVLIEGESGVGKELVAHHVHDLSSRRAGPFVAINCAALVETLLEAELFGIEDRTATGVRGRRGKFEHADGGTLFLDEISDLSPGAQAKLLRAIQDLAVERVGTCGARPVDTRVVVATNRSLDEMVRAGRFRTDLFYRLSGVDIRVPPLRARPDDIMELVRYFLRRYSPGGWIEITPAAVEALRLYEWPGNVRELQRVVEGLVARGCRDRVGIDDLPGTISRDYADILLPALARAESMRAWGSRYARLMLDRCHDNKRATCRKLGITYHTLQSYLRYRPEEETSVEPRRSGWPAHEDEHHGALRVAERAEDALAAGAPAGAVMRTNEDAVR